MLDAGQLLVLGMVSSLFVQGLRLLSEHFGFVPNKVIVNVVVFIVSAILAVVFFGVPELGPEPVQGFVTLAVTIAGSALLIYNIVLDKVLMPPASKLASAIKFN